MPTASATVLALARPNPDPNATPRFSLSNDECIELRGIVERYRKCELLHSRLNSRESRRLTYWGRSLVREELALGIRRGESPEKLRVRALLLSVIIGCNAPQVEQQVGRLKNVAAQVIEKNGLQGALHPNALIGLWYDLLDRSIRQLRELTEAFTSAREKAGEPAVAHGRLYLICRDLSVALEKSDVYETQRAEMLLERPPPDSLTVAVAVPSRTLAPTTSPQPPAPARAKVPRRR